MAKKKSSAIKVSESDELDAPNQVIENDSIGDVIAEAEAENGPGKIQDPVPVDRTAEYMSEIVSAVRTHSENWRIYASNRYAKKPEALNVLIDRLVEKFKVELR